MCRATPTSCPGGVAGGVLYVNGAVVHTFTPGGYNLTSTGTALSLGGGDTGYNGDLDEVELFNRALSQGEIQNIYTAGTSGKCKTPTATPTSTFTPTATATPTPPCAQPPANMVAWYPLDEASGTAADDLIHHNVDPHSRPCRRISSRRRSRMVCTSPAAAVRPPTA